MSSKYLVNSMNIFIYGVIVTEMDNNISNLIYLDGDSTLSYIATTSRR